MTDEYCMPDESGYIHCPHCREHTELAATSETAPGAMVECQCSEEQGDRDCPVHPACCNCGELLLDEYGEPLVNMLRVTEPTPGPALPEDTEVQALVDRLVEERVVGTAKKSAIVAAAAGDVEVLRSMVREKPQYMSSDATVAFDRATIIDRAALVEWLVRVRDHGTTSWRSMPPDVRALLETNDETI